MKRILLGALLVSVTICSTQLMASEADISYQFGLGGNGAALLRPELGWKAPEFGYTSSNPAIKEASIFLPLLKGVDKDQYWEMTITGGAFTCQAHPEPKILLKVNDQPIKNMTYKNDTNSQVVILPGFFVNRSAINMALKFVVDDPIYLSSLNVFAANQSLTLQSISFKPYIYRIADIQAEAERTVGAQMLLKLAQEAHASRDFHESVKAGSTQESLAARLSYVEFAINQERDRQKYMQLWQFKSSEGLPAGFDPATYIRLNADLQDYIRANAAEIAAAGGEHQWAVNHYRTYGQRENRKFQVNESGGSAAAPVESLPDAFDAAAYIQANVDLQQYILGNPAVIAAAGGPNKWAKKHYDSHGRNEGRRIS